VGAVVGAIVSAPSGGGRTGAAVVDAAGAGVSPGATGAAIKFKLYVVW
jgi:hypothetical protein